MSALVIHLPAQPVTASTEFEYVLTRGNGGVQSHGSAPAALLPAPGRAGAEVVAVVPPERISWHRVELPKGTSIGSPRLRAVLEGLLEDQLLDEPQALHLALQPQRTASGQLWVAACDRAWLRDAIQVLEAAQRPASRIVPEFAPEDAPAIYVIGDPQQALVVSVSSDAVTMLPLSSQALPLLPAASENVPCLAEPAVAALTEQMLHRQPLLQQAPQRWLLSAQSPWDLAQFEFSSSGRARALKKLGTAWDHLLTARQWRPLRWGAALLVVVNVASLNAWAWRERSALQQKREAIHSVLTQTFPQVKVVVDPPAQMEKEVVILRQATGAASSRDLEAMLSALTGASPPSHQISILDFSAGELRAKGLAYSPDQAQTVASALKGRGYTSTSQADMLVVAPQSTP